MDPVPASETAACPALTQTVTDTTTAQTPERNKEDQKVAKKHDRKWCKNQRKWRKRDSQTIGTVHVFLNHRIDRLIEQYQHTSYVKAIDDDTMISATKVEPFRINRQHPLWSTFPINWFAGKRPPNWENLSEWGKLQIAMIPLSELGCVTFTGNLHPDLEKELVAGRCDVRTHLRNALSKALQRETGISRLEFFFVVEGHTKGVKKTTRLHIHGAIASDRLQPGILGEDQIKRAVAKAVGQWKSGAIGKRAVDVRKYWKPGKAFVTYLSKRIRSKDDRLLAQRLAISRPLTAGAREFWLAVSGLDGSRQVGRSARVAPKGSLAARIAHARALLKQRSSALQSERMRFSHATKRQQMGQMPKAGNPSGTNKQMTVRKSP